ncbi:hypothetical protein BpHYR1_027091 [Brachionus plicatilis]|uniref:Uncharacterized protein n=1 Tax=Brachionus plicatilis TaxID=10195 RepID=A0A3M7SFZ6_BRAPC|nr:hypothetical protein BpHYR1_027091 [Brachionus plicatilis]
MIEPNRTDERHLGKMTKILRVVLSSCKFELITNPKYSILGTMFSFLPLKKKSYLKRIGPKKGDKIPPCFTPHSTLNRSERLSFRLTKALAES